MSTIRRWFCRMLNCHALCNGHEAKPLPPVPPSVSAKEEQYREASHEMRNAVADLQGVVKRVTNAFDVLADRWDR